MFNYLLIGYSHLPIRRDDLWWEKIGKSFTNIKQEVCNPTQFGKFLENIIWEVCNFTVQTCNLGSIPTIIEYLRSIKCKPNAIVYQWIFVGIWQSNVIIE